MFVFRYISSTNYVVLKKKSRVSHLVHGFLFIYILDVKKKELVEEMTNEQFRVILAMIVQIIKDNRKEEAIQKIEAILASSFRSL